MDTNDVLGSFNCMLLLSRPRPCTHHAGASVKTLCVARLKRLTRPWQQILIFLSFSLRNKAALFSFLLSGNGWRPWQDLCDLNFPLTRKRFICSSSAGFMCLPLFFFLFKKYTTSSLVSPTLSCSFFCVHHSARLLISHCCLTPDRWWQWRRHISQQNSLRVWDCSHWRAALNSGGGLSTQSWRAPLFNMRLEEAWLPIKALLYLFVRKCGTQAQSVKFYS